MPTQSKKSQVLSPTERCPKPKKKKKKDSGRDSSRKISTSGPLIPTEGDKGTSRTKSRSTTDINKDSTSGLNSLSSSADSTQSSSSSTSSSSSASNSCRVSSSDGRSTSSSGENWAVTCCTSSSKAELGLGNVSKLSSVVTRINESLRWDSVLQDPEEETERIRIYKLNRRKRYMDFLQRRSGEELRSFYV